MATAPLSCFAIAAPGLEQLVANELIALGERPRIEEGGVGWQGDARSMMRANLWLRTASRVLVRVARFSATAFFELEKRGKQIPWRDFVVPGRSVEFRVTARKSKLYHSDAIAERLLAAVARAAKPATGKAAREQPDAPAQLFVVRVHRDEFVISADTSGDLLHMRGYRQAVAKAPLRETLAAALLFAAGWRGDTPLVDPFCGSGTIPIEGALMARRMAPGVARHYAFMEWPGFDRAAWSALLHEAAEGALASSPVPLFGSDRDAGAVASARANAERAGVAGDIEFSVRAVSTFARSHAGGLVATNPPYGVRVGEKGSIRNLYSRFGHVLREHAAGWRVALYSADDGLAAQLGLPLREVLRTSNGGIPVRALMAKLPSSSEVGPA